MFDRLRLQRKRRRYTELNSFDTFGCFCPDNSPEPHGDSCGLAKKEKRMQKMRGRGFKIVKKELLGGFIRYHWVNDTTQEKVIQGHECGR